MLLIMGRFKSYMALEGDRKYTQRFIHFLKLWQNKSAVLLGQNEGF